MSEKVMCSICHQIFKDTDGLEKHNAAKHEPRERHKFIEGKSIEKKKVVDEQHNSRFLMYTFIGIIILAGAVYTFSTLGSSSELDAFAECLTNKGAVMYGAFWCPHCAEQKKVFGNAFKEINYVECSTPDRKAQIPACTAAGIQTYPTWKFSDGSSQGGVLSLAQLAAKTGCSAKQ